MKTLKYFLIALLIPAFFLTSCKEDDDNNDDDAQPAFEILKDYLVAQDMDLDHIIKTAEGKKFVTGAPATDADVADWAAGYDILDIRNSDAFASGHIVGAKNVAFENLLTEAATATKPMLIVCFTGQTACFATSLLRLASYDAQALKWGMSGWNVKFDSWTAKCSDQADGDANWNFDAAPTASMYENPTFTSTATDGAAILMQQIENVFAEGFSANTASGTDVLGTPSAYFINNYFSEESNDFTDFGHIKEANRINPLLLSDNTYLGLNPDGKIVTYCYTGQTSAVITAYLNVIGYDAVTMTFGMNGLWNSSSAWSTNQWGGDSNPKELSYEE